MQDSKKILSEDYDNPYSVEYYNEFVQKPVVLIGTFSFILSIILSFAPVAVLFLCFDLIPSAKEIIAISFLVISTSISWWIVEPISYYPILGSMASYITFLAGGYGVRTACAIAAQEATNSKAGTQRGDIMAALGVAGSYAVKIVFVILSLIVGSLLVGSNTSTIRQVLSYVPASFYVPLFVKLIVDNPKTSMVGVVSSIFIIFVGSLFLPSSVFIILNVIIVVTVNICRYFKLKKADQSEIH